MNKKKYLKVVGKDGDILYIRVETIILLHVGKNKIVSLHTSDGNKSIIEATDIYEVDSIDVFNKDINDK